jgi:hypothetical protein
MQYVDKYKWILFYGAILESLIEIKIFVKLNAQQEYKTRRLKIILKVF